MKVIFPENYWIHLKNVRNMGVRETHIKEVVENPETFGMTLDDIKLIYDKCDETLGEEGNASDFVKQQLIRKGWIYVKYNSTNDIYNVELFNLDDASRISLWTWAGILLIGKDKNRRSSKVCVFNFEGKLEYESTLEEVYL